MNTALQQLVRDLQQSGNTPIPIARLPTYARIYTPLMAYLLTNPTATFSHYAYEWPPWFQYHAEDPQYGAFNRILFFYHDNEGWAIPDKHHPVDLRACLYHIPAHQSRCKIIPAPHPMLVHPHHLIQLYRNLYAIYRMEILPLTHTLIIGTCYRGRAPHLWCVRPKHVKDETPWAVAIALATIYCMGAPHSHIPNSINLPNYFTHTTNSQIFNAPWYYYTPDYR